MRTRRGWTAVESAISGALVATVLVAAGNFITQTARRSAYATARAAAVEQANRFADILERYAVRSISYWGTTSYEGETGIILYCLPDEKMDTESNLVSSSIETDPNGNNWLWNAGRYIVYFSGPDGTWADGNDSMVMIARVTQWKSDTVPFNYQPLPHLTVDAQGNSLFPCISRVQQSVSMRDGWVSITVTARVHAPTGGTKAAPSSTDSETIVVTRRVSRAR